MNLFYLLALLVLPLQVHADTPSTPGNKIDDAAFQKAMSDARIKTDRVNREMGASPTRAAQSMPTISNEKLKATQGIDPSELARQYADLDRRPDGPTEDLLVFISLSMPMNTLRLLGEQAHRANAVLVLRGIKGGLGKGNYAQMLKQLKPVVATGAAIQINPNLFKQFSVQAVPTFVLTGRPVEGCSADKCAADSVSVQGDVSLGYALEHFAKRDNTLGRIAQERLNKMNPEAR